MRNPRVAVTVAVLSGLAAAGAGLYAVTRPWQTEQISRPAPLPPEVVSRTGAELAVWSAPAAVVGLAAAVAIVAVSGRGRRAVSVCSMLSGIGLLTAAGYGIAIAPGGWPVVTGLFGAGLAVVGGWTWRAGAGWPAMSARYDRTDDDPEPSPALADNPETLWDALDRGVDPTSLRIGETAPGKECAR